MLGNGKAALFDLLAAGLTIPRGLQLLKANYPLTVYDRNPKKTRSFSKQGADVADSPKLLAFHCEIVIACVAHDQAVEAVMMGDQGVIVSAKTDAILSDVINRSLG